MTSANFSSHLNDAVIGIQAKGRLAAGSMEWLNERCGTDFPVSEKPFGDNPRREFTDQSTGITVRGFSNADLCPIAANPRLRKLAELVVVGGDKFYESIAETKAPEDIERPPALKLSIHQLAYLGFAPCTLMIGKPTTDQDREVHTVVTSYPKLADRYFYMLTPPVREELHFPEDSLDPASRPEIVYVHGGTEMVARCAFNGGADAIIDVVDSGRSMQENGYMPKDEIIHFGAMLVAGTTVAYEIDIPDNMHTASPVQPTSLLHELTL